MPRTGEMRTSALWRVFRTYARPYTALILATAIVFKPDVVHSFDLVKYDRTDIVNGIHISTPMLSDFALRNGERLNAGSSAMERSSADTPPSPGDT